MTKRKSVIHEEIDRFGVSAGLKKKSGRWYRHCEDVIVVVDLQKSYWGNSYYVNMGFFLRALGEKLFPLGRECPISVRLESLGQDQQSRIEKILNLEYDIADDQRLKELSDFLDSYLRPALERGCSMVGLRTMVDDGTLSNARVTGEAETLLRTI